MRAPQHETSENLISNNDEKDEAIEGQERAVGDGGGVKKKQTCVDNDVLLGVLAPLIQQHPCAMPPQNRPVTSGPRIVFLNTRSKRASERKRDGRSFEYWSINSVVISIGKSISRFQNTSYKDPTKKGHHKHLQPHTYIHIYVST